MKTISFLFESQLPHHDLAMLSMHQASNSSLNFF